MAWSEVALTQAAGTLLTQLDTLLPANANWSIYDTPAANTRVYRNLDVTANSEFYVYIDDTQNNYASVILWAGWDAVGHAGTGLRQPTVASGYTAYIRKPAGNIGVSVKDLNFKIANLVTSCGYYIGQLNRADSTKNMPILVATYSSSTATNPLGEYPTILNVLWLMLKNDVGSQESVSPFLYNNSDFYIRSSDGRYYLFDSLIYGWTSLRVFGQLDGVCSFAGSPNSNSLSSLDVLWVGAQSWIALTGNSNYSVMERA